MDYQWEASKILTMMDMLGKAQVFEARKKALSSMTKETIEYEGLLLGGKLKITLEFDERKDGLG